MLELNPHFLMPCLPPQGGKMKHHWGNWKSKCQTTTLYESCVSLSNEMPLVHHVVEWWGYEYTYKDNKGLSEKTQGHSMLKPKSKLM